MWAPDTESALFRGVCKYKPSGVNKHWHMINISLYMNQTLKSNPVTIDDCWARLGELYDLAGVETIEEESRDDSEREFELRWDEFGDLMLEHAIATEPSEDEESEDEKSTPQAAPVKEEDEDEDEEEDENGEEADVDDGDGDEDEGRDSRASSMGPDDERRSRRRRGTTPEDEPRGRRQSGRLARARAEPKSDAKSDAKDAKDAKAEPKKRRVATTPKRRQPPPKKEESTPAAKRRKRK